RQADLRATVDETDLHPARAEDDVVLRDTQCSPQREREVVGRRGALRHVRGVDRHDAGREGRCPVRRRDKGRHAHERVLPLRGEDGVMAPLLSGAQIVDTRFQSRNLILQPCDLGLRGAARREVVCLIRTRLCARPDGVRGTRGGERCPRPAARAVPAAPPLYADSARDFAVPAPLYALSARDCAVAALLIPVPAREYAESARDWAFAAADKASPARPYAESARACAASAAFRAP